MISAEQLAVFHNDGFLHVTDLFLPSTVETIRAELSRLLLDPPPDLKFTREQSQPAPPRKMRNVCEFSKLIRDACLHPNIVSIAQRILAAPVGFYGDQVLFKVAYYGSAKPMHQDAAYFRSVPEDSVITFWCALDDASHANGCMQYVRGSHRHGLCRHTQMAGTPHLVAQVADAFLTDVPVQKGDAVIHSCLTLHSTRANTSNHDRWAILLHFARLDAHFPHKSSTTSPLVALE
jgi:ectoine hydroxylase-related dioxygenase (phytanoyl-CoA dioxygenase family)